MTASPNLAPVTERGRHAQVNRARLALAALAGLACLAGTAGCSTAPALPAMPAESHYLPTVFGPLNGSGDKAFTVTVRPAMSVELGCLGNSKDLAWVHSPISGFAVPCGSPGNESFGGSYDQDLERKLRPGQRVPVQITAPAGDTWQLWITGGPAPAPATGASRSRERTRN